MNVQTTPYYAVLHRAQLHLSAERGPSLGLMLVSFLLPIISLNLPGVIVAILLWMVGLPALQRMAKKDPQMMIMFLRHISYFRHYEAHSRPGVQVRRASVS